MTSLGDTPTPTMLTPEVGSVSIKIEQGVLCENYDDYVGSRFNAEKQDIPTVRFESNHPTDTENGSVGIGDDDYNMFNISHSIFQPDFEIKAEPGVDIDDRHPEEEGEESMCRSLSPNESSTKTPKIRLTPTSKLIATPDGPTTDNKRRYACPYENCTKSYGKSSHLRSHLTWHTGIKPFVCKEPGCGKGFTRSDELNRHIRTHTGEKPFECVQCTKKFSRSDHLTKHLATHTKQLAASNGTLPKKVKNDKNPPQSSIKMFSSIVSESVRDRSDSLTTIPSIGPVDVKDNSNTKELSFSNTSVPQSNYDDSELITKCPEATQMGSLNIKLEKPENNYDYIKGQTEQEINKVSSFEMPQNSNIKQELDVVIKPEPSDELHVSKEDEISYANEPDDDAIMPEANLPPLLHSSPINSAPVKPKASCQLNQTLNHIADSVYDPTRPFPCSHCTKNFKRQDDLNRHMRTHTGEKPFACNECDKRFMRSDHLKKHMNTHTRVR